MHQTNDYKAGFTQPILGPNGMLYGGAARNYRLGQIGGASGAQAQAIAAFNMHIEPVVTKMQNQLSQQQQMITQMVQMVQRMQDRNSDENK